VIFFQERYIFSEGIDAGYRQDHVSASTLPVYDYFASSIETTDNTFPESVSFTTTRRLSVLNSVLEVQAEAVHEFGGDIDKFVGDAVMALFVEPLSAVRCAFEMIRRVNHLAAGGDDPLHIYRIITVS
jgi:hypothetical protein